MVDRIEIPFLKLNDKKYMDGVFDSTHETAQTEEIIITGAQGLPKEEVLEKYQNSIFERLDLTVPKMVSNELTNAFLKKNAGKTDNYKMPSYEYVKNYSALEYSPEETFYLVSGYKYNWQEGEKERFKEIDGVIGNFEQGDTGDCWVLTGLKATSDTESGAEDIKENTFNSGDSVLMCFKGDEPSAANCYRITEDEFASDENKHLSTGDPDAKAWEIAKRKRLLDVDKTGTGYKSGKKDILTGGRPYKMIYDLTGKQPKKAYLANNLSITEPFEEIISGDSIDNILDELGKEQEEAIKHNKRAKLLSHIPFSDKIPYLKDYAKIKEEPIVTAGSYYEGEGERKSFMNGEKEAPEGIRRRHAYSVKKIDRAAKTVELINPTDTSPSSTITYEDFKNYFKQLAVN